MEAKISKILIELIFERITPQQATQQLLDLFAVSKAKRMACWNCGQELKYTENGVTQYHCSCGAVDPAG